MDEVRPRALQHLQTNALMDDLMDTWRINKTGKRVDDDLPKNFYSTTEFLTFVVQLLRTRFGMFNHLAMVLNDMNGHSRIWAYKDRFRTVKDEVATPTYFNYRYKYWKSYGRSIRLFIAFIPIVPLTIFLPTVLR